MYSNPSAEFYPRFQYALHTCVLRQCLIQASVEGMSIMHFSVSLIREAQCFQQFICSLCISATTASGQALSSVWWWCCVCLWVGVLLVLFVGCLFCVSVFCVGVV
ncbi:unnamed protein product [Polarella glacialis]|uniref:Uncharacterized protein n=1 Tax=Polarella glacialis TaxID=89957 RepID=A0A813G9S6_POLGL|nr:unnamed protein product [Polarella glacialis]